MPRQLNIRSNEAYRIAHRLAKQRKQTVTQVVTEALRMREGQLTTTSEVPPEEAAETYRILMELSERASRAAKPGSTSDLSDLYDEDGLPK
jgi:hypothetical protein